MPEQRDRPPEQEWVENGVRVGAWWVEPQRNRITWRGADGEAPAGMAHVDLEPKVMAVLVCMVRRPGKTITKQTFMEKVWAETVVSNDALLRCVSELRRALGDDARDPDYVETIRTVGYRLVAPVVFEPAPSAEAPAPSAGEATPTEASASPPEPAFLEPVSLEPVSLEPEEAGRIARPALLGRWAGRAASAGRRWQIAGLAFVLLVGAGVLAFLRAGDVADVPAPSAAVPFTSFPGEEFDPALSRDGERVAFVWNGGTEEGNAQAAGGEERRFDIYVKQHGAEEPMRLTQTPEREYSPAWGPGGNRLAFLRDTEEDTTGGTEVVVTPIVGGEERTVARFPGREVQDVAWSPRGQTLALAAQRRPYGAFRLVLLDLETRHRRVLTAPPGHYRGDVAPAFSPDGRTIAFARGVVDRVEDLYTVPVHKGGGSPARLTHDQAAISGLDWTADGQHIVFASDREGTSRLWRVASGGGTPTWVATAAAGGELRQPSIARKGVRMTLTERSLDVNIWRLHPVAGYGDRLISTRLLSSTRWDSAPDVSPSGKRLAFASKRSGSFEVWTSRRDGTSLTRLTHFGGPFVSAPRWGPNGEEIVFSVLGEEGADVYRVEATGGSPRRLTHAGASDVAPCFSRGGRWIYFGSNRSGRWQIWKSPADTTGGAPPRQVTQAGGFAAQESLDGTYLYYVKREEPGLWRRPLRPRDTLVTTMIAGNARAGDVVAGPAPGPLVNDTPTGEQRVIDTLEPFDWGNWAVTERGLYYVSRQGARPALMYQSSRRAAPVRMAYLDGLPRHPSLAVAPGARWFLHAKRERNESDILLVERF